MTERSVATPPTRRRFLKLTAAAATALAGCGSAGPQLKVFNWSDYIHPDLIPEFEKRTGARVIYDNYAADSELEARLATGGGGYDVVFPSDRAMPALLAKGLLGEIDKSRLTNLKHLDAKFLSAGFDPGNQHSVPYFWGTVAVGLRTDHVADKVTGFAPLFDEKYEGRITLLDDGENVVAAVLLHLGLPMNSVDPSDLQQAQDLLMKSRPLVQAYTSDAYKERLITGEAWVSLGWSGDLIQAADEAPEVNVVVPQSGTMLWIDSMAIPKQAENRELAHAFIDFLLEPEVAKRNAQAVHYATPNLAAKALLPADVQADARIYPPQQVLDRCQLLKNRGDKIAAVEAVWRAVRQG